MGRVPADVFAAITCTVKTEVQRGDWVWFSDRQAGVEGFREVEHLDPWAAPYGSFEYELAREWVTVAYTDGHEQHHPRYSTWEVWQSGPRPMVSDR